MNAVLRLWNRFCAIRFLVVGGWNAFFSYAVFGVLYYFWGGSLAGDAFVQVVSAVLGITNSFVCHKWVTYRSAGVWWREYFRFYVVYGGQALMQMLLFFALSTYAGFSAYLVQFTTMILLTFVTYWVHKRFSFRRK